MGSKDDFNVSNVTGGFTDEEFANELVAGPELLDPDNNRTFHYNFMGATLKNISTPRKLRREIKKN
ncbi:MAG: hypothetical protein ACOY4Q_06975 [Bacillota bacterium]